MGSAVVTTKIAKGQSISASPGIPVVVPLAQSSSDLQEVATARSMPQATPVSWTRQPSTGGACSPGPSRRREPKHSLPATLLSSSCNSPGRPSNVVSTAGLLQEKKPGQPVEQEESKLDKILQMRSTLDQILQNTQEQKLQSGEIDERRLLSETRAAKDDIEARMQSKLAACEEENTKLRARLESSEERLEKEQQTAAQLRSCLDSKASTDLEEKSTNESQLSQLKIRFATQSKQLDDKGSEVTDLKRQLNRAMQERHDLDTQLQAKGENDELQQRNRELEAALADSETRNKRNQKESDKVAKVLTYEKENKSLKQKMQDQHSKMRDLENQLRQAACQSRTPGEVWRMVESLEAKNHFSEENGRLGSLKNDLETERDLMRKEVDLFRKRLAPEVCAAIRREAADAVAAAALEASEVTGVQPFRELSPRLALR